MAFQRHGLKYDSRDVRTATAGATITDKYGVYLSSEDTIQHSTGFTTVGIARDGYSSGDKSAEYVTRGDLEFVAGGAIAVNAQIISDPSNAGYFISAPVGINGYGYCLSAAGTSGDYALGRFDFTAANIAGQVDAQYYDSAIAADDSFTFNAPAGNYMVWIYMAETAGNGATIKVGTTDGGTELVSVTASASTDYWKVPSDMTTQPITLTASDTIYVTSASWGSASIKFWMLAKRVS